MRIAVIAHLKYAIQEPFAGGLEKHTHMLVRGLRRRGHDVVLFSCVGSDPDLQPEIVSEATSVLECANETAEDAVFFHEHEAYLRLMLALRRRRFDVIHNNALHYLPVSMAHTLDAPMVTTLHTPPFRWLESGVRAGAPTLRYAAVSRATAKMWAHVTPVHDVVLNGVDLAQFAFRERSGPEPYLAWYGRIVPEKGLDLAIKAARLARLPLKIAGPILDRAYYEREIAPELGDDAVHVGHLGHEDLAALIGGAVAALCTPRWEEPYGLVVAEALACGTPVAAFRRGGVPEVLDASSGVLAEPGCAQGLAAAIRAAMLLDRRDCRRRAETACDVERMIDAYEAIYRDLCAGHAMGHRLATWDRVTPDLLGVA